MGKGTLVMPGPDDPIFDGKFVMSSPKRKPVKAVEATPDSDSDVPEAADATDDRDPTGR